MDNKDDYLNYFIFAITKKYDFMLEYFKDIKFIFISPKQKVFFKFTFSEATFKEKPIIITRLNALKNITPIEDILKADEEGDSTVITANKNSRFEKVLSQTEEIQEAKEIKKDNIKKAVSKNLGVKNTGREEDNDLIDSINNEIETTVEKMNKNEFKDPVEKAKGKSDKYNKL